MGRVIQLRTKRTAPARGVLLCLSLGLGGSQVMAATISGIVSDEAEPLSGVTVTVIDADSSVIVTTAHTSATGEYQIEVAPKHYKIRASKADYADSWVKANAVKADSLRLDISMTPQVFVDDTKVPPSDGCD